MIINDKLKLNRFKDVRVPSPRELFQRFGYARNGVCSYSNGEMISMPSRKIDSLNRADAFDRAMQYRDSLADRDSLANSPEANSAEVIQ